LLDGDVKSCLNSPALIFRIKPWDQSKGSGKAGIFCSYTPDWPEGQGKALDYSKKIYNTSFNPQGRTHRSAPTIKS
jgi:hypothetical protein